MTMVVNTSRIGRKPITVPTGVDVKIHDNKLSVKGPKGQLSINLHPFIHVSLEDNHIKVAPNASDKKSITGARKRLFSSIAGTERANINNMVKGVTEGFQKSLSLVGVGYRAQAKGKVLSLSLGFSHPTDYKVPEGIIVETPTQTEVIIKGISKELVGAVAAEIRAIRGPEPYKGKGVRYTNEKIVIKETKKK